MTLDPSRNEPNPRTAGHDLAFGATQNPYAAIHGYEPSDRQIGATEATPASAAKAILVWTIVCSLSAAPSFFWAINEVAKHQAVAMVVGICIFIGIYSAADLLSRNSPFRKNARMRSILRATFFVRSIMVVIFPVAMFTDLFIGMVSVNLVTGIVRLLDIDFVKNEMGFAMALTTTLVQGCLLSILLFFLGLLIAAIVFLLRSLVSRLG